MTILFRGVVVVYADHQCGTALIFTAFRGVRGGRVVVVWGKTQGIHAAAIIGLITSHWIFLNDLEKFEPSTLMLIN